MFQAFVSFAGMNSHINKPIKTKQGSENWLVAIVC
jgi:hypothetical protein